MFLQRWSVGLTENVWTGSKRALSEQYNADRADVRSTQEHSTFLRTLSRGADVSVI